MECHSKLNVTQNGMSLKIVRLLCSEKHVTEDDCCKEVESMPQQRGL